MIDASRYQVGADEAIRRGSAHEIATSNQPEVPRPRAHRKRPERHHDRIIFGRRIRPGCAQVAVRAKTDILWPVPHQQGR